MQNFIILILLMTTSCISRIDKTGYSFDLSQYQSIKEEISTKDEVFKIMGSPSFISFVGDKPVWVYFSQDKKKLLFFKPKIINRKILTIDFDDQQKIVNKVNLYDLDDQRNIKYVADYTNVEHQDQNIFLRLFENIGRISPN